jgi:hypothetical protein
VWLAGQRVGTVKRISFAPVTADTNRRLLLELDMLEEYQELIRRDSYAQIRSGGSLIGAPVVYITVGSDREPVLRDGAYMSSRPQVDAEGVTSEVALAARDFPPIIRNIREIGAQIKGMRQTVGSLTDDERSVRFEVVGRRAAGLTRRATAGGGTVALALRDEALLDRARRAIARADSLGDMLGRDSTTIARLRADSALQRALIDARNELSIVRVRLARAHGTAGRAVADSAIVQQVARLERELERTIEDFKRDPGRYVAF